MRVPQHIWMSCRGSHPTASSLLHLMTFLLTTSLFAQGAIVIPDLYVSPNISMPPTLTQVPTAFTAVTHEDIKLPCEATGNPPPIFRWEKDGKSFGPETQGSGTLEAKPEVPLKSYEGKYRCYASNTLGTAMTETVEVIIEPHPFLVKQNKLEETKYEGESLILTCNPPESSTPPKIYWMDKYMVHIEQSERVIIGLDGNLYFSNLLLDDSINGTTCNAHYVAARTILPDTMVQLSVLPRNDVTQGRRPRLVRPSGSHTSVLALRGQSITLECIPEGLPTPQVEWHKINGNLKKSKVTLKKYNRWLQINHITDDDDGEYRCVAFNIHGNASHAFSVTVQASPYWIKKTPNQMYTPGEFVRLDCLAKGDPEPNITWSINGQPLTNVDEDPRRSITREWLILREVGVADTAVYQCEATNKHGSILLNINMFVVELPPQILTADGLVYKVYEGQDIQMHCESFGSPRPHVTWVHKDMDALMSDPRVSLFSNGTVELMNVTHKDHGVYTCSIEDTNIFITANLHVFNQTMILSPPQNIQILKGETAVLHCGFYKDPKLHDYQVQWKKDGHRILGSSHDDRYTVFKNHTLKLSKVQSDDTAYYSCEVHIKHLGHVSATGSITVVGPPDSPHSLTLSDVKGSNVILSWIPGPSHNSPITEFIVEAQEEPQTEKGKPKWQGFGSVPGGLKDISLQLRPFCTYRFRVVAVNDVGKSSPSEPTDVHHTPSAVPDQNPVGVQSNSTDPGTLLITWVEMEKRFHNSQDFRYKVYWRKAQGISSNWNSVIAISPPFAINNTGAYTQFQIKVQAVNRDGPGPEPTPHIGYSGEDKPEEPPTGISSTVKNSTVKITWKEAQRVRGRLLGYKIYIRRLGSQNERGRRSLGKYTDFEENGRMEQQKDNNRNTWMILANSTETSKEVTGLPLYSRYELWILAINKRGESPPSPLHHFSTPEGAPGPPGSLRFESPTEMSLILYWTPPLETNGRLLGYVVQYQREVEIQDNLLQIQMISDPHVNHIMLDSLDPRCYYTFKVIARTSAGEGPPITKRGATLLEGAPPSNITVVSGNTSFNLSWVPGERDRNHIFNIRYYRKSGGGQWKESEVVNSTQGFYSLTGLQSGTEYHLMILKGNNTQWQDVKWTRGPVPSEMPGGFSTQGWLIGLISAILLLILILLILCLIKSRRGGKYSVKEKEKTELGSEVCPVKEELYSDGDEKRSDSQQSLCDDSKLGSDDSLAEYGDSVDIQFNEDGSFIGQYSGRGPVPHGNESSGPASPANAVPPPPITLSMSSILNRPC
ncbi:neural cell adhesion molecule L1.1 isoform X2 [Nothobranchius furzeri]|uniref:neural cell adhesion molecule L1.1 isoform X2 n=1 Tax=Nothobranchius furzeri TaxID=105023 RepID=UPI003904C5C6